MISRRQFIRIFPAAGLLASPAVRAAVSAPFNLRYVLSSAMYGEMPLDAILPEVAKTGSEGIDIWCRVHGNQREQIAAMGDAAFLTLLKQHRVKLGVSTRYPLGPFGLQDEMGWMKQFGGGIIVTGSKGADEVSGAAAKAAVRQFIEEMETHAAKAEECGVTIAIENHNRQLLFHPDSLRYFADFNRSPRLGMALAFHHLHRWVDQIPALIRNQELTVINGRVFNCRL